MQIVTTKLNLKQLLNGKLAEDSAATFLKKQGLKIIARNYRQKVGEIDIIAVNSKSKQIIFVEVKYRKSSAFGGSYAAIGEAKLQKLYATASLWLATNTKFDSYLCRFDAVLIEGEGMDVKLSWLQGILING